MANNIQNEALREIVIDMLNQSYNVMLKKAEKILDKGSLSDNLSEEFNEWDRELSKLILPKTIIAAVLKSELREYNGTGTEHEKKIDKKINDLSYLLHL